MISISKQFNQRNTPHTDFARFHNKGGQGVRSPPFFLRTSLTVPSHFPHGSLRNQISGFLSFFGSKNNKND